MRVVIALAVLSGVVANGAARAQAFRAPCHVDTLCAGVETGGGRIMACLRAHKNELSEQCLAAIGRSVMNWRAKDQSGGGGATAAPNGPAGASEPDPPPQ